MTFEEFLIKKKIDPVQLKNTEQALFSEFNSHFNEMGEKSFDHSKKFWFNKLRRAYLLIEVPKAEPITLSSPISISDLHVITPISIESEIKKELVEGEITTPKPAYKPRFKAAISVSEVPKVENKEEQNLQPKPAYKPRFKAEIITKNPGQE